MGEATPTCRVCGAELAGRDVYEGVCARCREEEVLGKARMPKTPQPPRPAGPAPRPEPVALAPTVDADADTKEMAPVEEAAGELPEQDTSEAELPVLSLHEEGEPSEGADEAELPALSFEVPLRADAARPAEAPTEGPHPQAQQPASGEAAQEEAEEAADQPPVIPLHIDAALYGTAQGAEAPADQAPPESPTAIPEPARQPPVREEGPAAVGLVPREPSEPAPPAKPQALLQPLQLHPEESRPRPYGKTLSDGPTLRLQVDADELASATRPALAQRFDSLERQIRQLTARLGEVTAHTGMLTGPVAFGFRLGLGLILALGAVALLLGLGMFAVGTLLHPPTLDLLKRLLGGA